MYKVLIVDDDKLARKGLISIINWGKCGMTVVGEASNGYKALEFMEKNPVDLAVVDLTMPVLSGIELIEESQKKWPNLQFVVLSFHEDFQYVQTALRLGVLDYISKIRLEQEDCEKIFQRIGYLLEQKLETQNTFTEASDEINVHTPEDDCLNELRSEWCMLRWVYVQDTFDELCNKTHLAPLTPRQMEHLLILIEQSTLEAFKIEAVEIPALPNVRTGVEWLISYRKLLIKDVQQKGDGSLIPVCILRASLSSCECLSTPIRIEDAAAIVNMSRSYFATNFKKSTGITFNEFLRGERVRKAKILLEKGELSLNDVSQAVGYENHQYFCRVFIEICGISPSEYKEKQRKN